jgi:hypothetical protein
MHHVLPYQPPDQSPQHIESARDDMMFLLATLLIGLLVCACVAGYAYAALLRGVRIEMSGFWTSALVAGVMVLPGIVQATIKLVSGGGQRTLAMWVLLVNLAPIAMHGVVIILG